MPRELSREEYLLCSIVEAAARCADSLYCGTTAQQETSRESMMRMADELSDKLSASQVKNLILFLQRVEGAQIVKSGKPRKGKR